MVAGLFTAEMFLRRNSWLEAGLQFYLPAALFMLLRDLQVQELAWHLLGIGILWLALDLTLGWTFTETRLLRWPVRAMGTLFTAYNTIYLLGSGAHGSRLATICFSFYTAFFLIYAILHHRAWVGYGFSLFAPLTAIQGLGGFNQPTWLLPVTAMGALFYGAGFFSRNPKEDSPENWSFVAWSSGLGIALMASLAALFQGGLESAIPPAITATMVTMEAFRRRNIWLGFPANLLYLMAYFILLVELLVDEPQFYSIATAALGLLMHYLLTRAGSKFGAFITGMVSQLVLLGTTYIQFLSNEQLVFFTVLFFQALVVLIYGLVIRSRSLVFTPILFTVLSVLTVMFGLLQGIMTIVMIGCTGLMLLSLGILAVVMRERLKQIGERFSDWGA
jgi:hypothetical protein